MPIAPTTVQSKDSVPAISETQEGSCALAEDACQTRITEEILVTHEVFTGYASDVEDDVPMVEDESEDADDESGAV